MNSIRLMRRFCTPIRICGLSIFVGIAIAIVLGTLIINQIINSVFAIILIGVWVQMSIIERYLRNKSEECFAIIESEGIFEIIDGVIESDKNLIPIGDRAKKLIFDRGITEEVYSEHRTLMDYLNAFDIRTILPKKDVEYCVMTFVDQLNNSGKYHFSWLQQNILIDFLSTKKVFEINIGMIMYTSDKVHLTEKRDELRMKIDAISRAIADLTESK